MRIIVEYNSVQVYLYVYVGVCSRSRETLVKDAYTGGKVTGLLRDVEQNILISLRILYCNIVTDLLFSSDEIYIIFYALLYYTHTILYYNIYHVGLYLRLTYDIDEQVFFYNVVLLIDAPPPLYNSTFRYPLLAPPCTVIKNVLNYYKTTTIIISQCTKKSVANNITRGRISFTLLYHL